jgi:RNA polymerase sigma-70 factor (ECF subfamily)
MEEDPFKILVKDPEQGLKLIMAKHGSQLKRRIRNFISNDDELVKDALSETLIVLYVDREKIVAHTDPFMWMMVIAKHIALNTLRREKTDRKVSMDEIEEPPDGDTADANLNYKEMLELILSKAEQLTPMEKKVLIDSKVHGLDNKELETRYNLHAQRVRNLLSTARAKIRRLLKR